MQTKVYGQLAVSDPLQIKQEAMLVRLLDLMKVERLEFGEATTLAGAEEKTDLTRKLDEWVAKGFV